MTPSKLQITISVELEGENGETRILKREAESFESAEEDLGKLEVAVEKIMNQNT